MIARRRARAFSQGRKPRRIPSPSSQASGMASGGEDHSRAGYGLIISPAAAAVAACRARRGVGPAQIDVPARTTAAPAARPPCAAYAQRDSAVQAPARGTANALTILAGSTRPCSRMARPMAEPSVRKPCHMPPARTRPARAAHKRRRRRDQRGKPATRHRPFATTSTGSAKASCGFTTRQPSSAPASHGRRSNEPQPAAPAAPPSGSRSARARRLAHHRRVGGQRHPPAPADAHQARRRIASA